MTYVFNMKCPCCNDTILLTTEMIDPNDVTCGECMWTNTQTVKLSVIQEQELNAWYHDEHQRRLIAADGSTGNVMSAYTVIFGVMTPQESMNLFNYLNQRNIK